MATTEFLGMVGPEDIRDYAVSEGWSVVSDRAGSWLLQAPGASEVQVILPKAGSSRSVSMFLDLACATIATYAGLAVHEMVSQITVAALAGRVDQKNQAINQLLTAIMPLSVAGKAVSDDQEQPVRLDLEPATLRRAWIAVQYATGTIPALPDQWKGIHDGPTLRTLQFYGLERSDLPAQVYYLAQVVRQFRRVVRALEQRENAQEAARAEDHTQTWIEDEEAR